MTNTIILTIKKLKKYLIFSIFSQANMIWAQVDRCPETDCIPSSGSLDKFLGGAFTFAVISHIIYCIISRKIGGLTIYFMLTAAVSGGMGLLLAIKFDDRSIPILIFAFVCYKVASYIMNKK